MKILQYVIALCIVLATIGQNASAHVLVTDETQSKGAILHIMPDDDPIAGQRSTLFFDTQDQLLRPAGDNRVKLTVQSPDGNLTTIPTKIDGTLITASYTFPSQGQYKITYKILHSDRTYTFTQSQRVSRGVAGSALDKPTYVWAEALAIGAGSGIVILLILAFNRRRDIVKQSKF